MRLSSVAAYVDAVEGALVPLRDARRAVAMAAYMKDRFSFLGIPAPARRAAIKPIPRPAPAKVHPIVRALWKRREREYQYVALDLFDSMARELDTSKSLALVEELTLKKSWWDCVDGLAGIGSKILRHNANARGVVRNWSSHQSFWVNRLAILHQNGWGDATDQKVLFKICLAHAHKEEFFVRKAIGWALREYAWNNPTAVRDFVERNANILSKLSAREAMKNIGEQA
ncbi:DNA alkylation repair protein [Bradyrhizobium sp.]|uniref:DNA alkylation repair protein n=1 Tax=Bradyrhizobium sp. TaxID=376 RepID=UPI003C751BA2